MKSLTFFLCCVLMYTNYSNYQSHKNTTAKLELLSLRIDSIGLAKETTSLKREADTMKKFNAITGYNTASINILEKRIDLLVRRN